MNAKTAIHAYNKVNLESGVSAASPHELISLLYQGALQAIANAKRGMLSKDITAKGKAISHAILIIDTGLNASLDKKVGGELAQNLSALYDYMSSRLLTANIQNDVKALDEVSQLLADLKSAWDGIRPATAPATDTLAHGARSAVYAKG